MRTRTVDLAGNLIGTNLRKHLKRGGQEQVRTFRVYKAEGVGDKTVEDVSIVIDNEIPAIESSSLDALEKRYVSDARSIVHALTTSLPQATLRRVVVYLLEGTAGYYRMALGKDDI